jgi:NtrC-family two-component system sensor histidine kinase KinB
MPLRRKLLLSMVTPTVLILVVGVSGVCSLLRLEQAAGRILSANYQSIQHARRMERSVWLLQAGLQGNEEPEQRQKLRQEWVDGFESALRACEGNVTEPGESAVLQKIRHAWESLDQGGSGAASEATVIEVAARLHKAIAELVILNEQAMVALERETGRVARLMIGGVAVSALAATLTLGVFALISARLIAAPVSQVAERLHLALNPTGEGLTRGHESGDEIARLRQELDDLLGRLAQYEDEQHRKLANLQGRLAFVINEVLEGLVLLDDQHRILAVNRVGRRILGTTNGEGVRLGDLQPREDVKRMLAPILDRSFQPERDLGEIRFAGDGSERIYRPRILTVSGREGNVEGYLILFWDVTEQRRFEDARHRFISMLSHQLKTPMTSLSMSMNLLRERLREASPQQAELLTIATDECGNLSRLVSELIEAARDQTPDLVLKPRRRDLVPILRSALRPLRPQADEKGIELTLPGAESPVMARVDPVKFPWVVTNLAGNALRYTGRGGRIAVSVFQTGENVEIIVADTGRGIPQEDLDRIFEPYVTVDDDREPGTHGLGLAIAREIVVAHGGTLEVESEPGEGTVFRIQLPAGKDQG